jgi:hypothetical protein
MGLHGLVHEKLYFFYQAQYFSFIIIIMLDKLSGFSSSQNGCYVLVVVQLFLGSRGLKFS